MAKDYSKLVAKRITDKTGRMTTVWVKMNEIQKPKSVIKIHYDNFKKSIKEIGTDVTVPAYMFLSDKQNKVTERKLNINSRSVLGSYYDLESNNLGFYSENESEKDLHFSHEFGHYFAEREGIIKNDKLVDEKMKKVYEGAEKELLRLDKKMKNTLKQVNPSYDREILSLSKNYKDYKNMIKQIYENGGFEVTEDKRGGLNITKEASSFMDFVMSIDVRYGRGHERFYMSIKNHHEFMAHSAELYFNGNKYIEKYFPKTAKKIKSWWKEREKIAKNLKTKLK